LFLSLVSLSGFSVFVFSASQVLSFSMSKQALGGILYDVCR
jgi:hypothetical protein